MNELQKQFEKETGKKWLVIPYTHGENAYASWEYQLWLEARVNPLGAEVMQKTAGSADEIFIKGKIEGLEEARWQIVYALPHIDPNGRLEKKTKYLMDEMKKVQEELRAKL